LLQRGYDNRDIFKKYIFYGYLLSGYGRKLAIFIYLFSDFDEYLSDFLKKIVVELHKSHQTPFFIGRLLTFLFVLIVICNEYISFPFVLHHYFSIQVYLVIMILV
jgi:hypothetical protein